MSNNENIEKTIKLLNDELGKKIDLLEQLFLKISYLLKIHFLETKRETPYSKFMKNKELYRIKNISDLEKNISKIPYYFTEINNFKYYYLCDFERQAFYFINHEIENFLTDKSKKIVDYIYDFTETHDRITVINKRLNELKHELEGLPHQFELNFLSYKKEEQYVTTIRYFLNNNLFDSPDDECIQINKIIFPIKLGWTSYYYGIEEKILEPMSKKSYALFPSNLACGCLAEEVSGSINKWIIDGKKSFDNNGITNIFECVSEKNDWSLLSNDGTTVFLQILYAISKNISIAPFFKNFYNLEYNQTLVLLHSIEKKYTTHGYTQSIPILNENGIKFLNDNVTDEIKKSIDDITIGV